MSNKKIEKLAKQLEEKKCKKTMLEGELNPLKKEMEGLGLNSIEEAKAERDKLVNRKERMQSRIDDLLKEFEDEFGDNLDI